MTVVHDDKLFAELARLGLSFPRSTNGTSATPPTATKLGERYYDETNLREWLWDGTGWIVMYEPDQTYAPSTTNISSATSTGRFNRSAGFCDFFAEVTLSGAGVVTGQPTISLPRAFAVHPRGAFGVNLKDASGLGYVGGHEALAAAATTISIYFQDKTAAAAAVYLNNVLAGAPVTWIAPDVFSVIGHGKLNTPYL